MSNKLIITSRIQGDEAHISFDGIIDEDASFEKISSLKMKKYFFDFEKIKMINSCGIRDWIKFLDEIVDAQINYANCPQIIIEQINMVHGFIRAGVSVESFYAPYFCESCDDEKKVLIKISEMQGFSAPIKKCTKCLNQLEFDAIEKQYFSFLGQGK